MKRITFFALVVSALLLLVSSCDDNNIYPKASESICIINNAGDTISVLLPPGDSTMVERLVPDSGAVWHYFSYKSYQLYMSEADFENRISELKIFRTQQADTLYVNPAYYGRSTQWTRSFIPDDWFGYRSYVNQRQFVVTAAMFEQ